MNELNSIGPNTELCGTPETNKLIGFQCYLFQCAVSFILKEYPLKICKHSF